MNLLYFIYLALLFVLSIIGKKVTGRQPFPSFTRHVGMLIYFPISNQLSEIYVKFLNLNCNRK